MAFLELHRIGKPAQGIAKGPNGELDQNIAISRRIVMGKQALAVLPHFKPETDEIALTAVDPPRLQFGLE
jgi:hypothetical protein